MRKTAPILAAFTAALAITACAKMPYISENEPMSAPFAETSSFTKEPDVFSD